MVLASPTSLPFFQGKKRQPTPEKSLLLFGGQCRLHCVAPLPSFLVKTGQEHHNMVAQNSYILINYADFDTVHKAFLEQFGFQGCISAMTFHWFQWSSELESPSQRDKFVASSGECRTHGLKTYLWKCLLLG